MEWAGAPAAPAAGAADQPPAGLAHVDAWIFDLDNTLYPAAAGLFPQIHDRMNRFIRRRFGVDEARAAAIRRDLYLAHGTTLRGLMLEHGIEPHAFLAEVHDVDTSVVAPDPGLVAAVRRLPGRCFVFTNADRAYAERVLARIGFDGREFDALWDVEAAGFVPKPEAATYGAFVAETGVRPERAAFFEDQPRNLMVPARLGMATVLVVPRDLDAVEPELAVQNRGGAHVAFRTSDLAGFLSERFR